jgi:hypothetical protein
MNVLAPSGSGQWDYQLVTATSADGLLTQVTTLGQQGWELAAFAVDPQRSDRYVAIVKRQKQ